MSHDFLASLHSQVIPDSAEKRAAKSGKNSLQEQKLAADTIVADDRNRTIGVSMPPKLRERAGARAAAVGLSFSRYVQWCIEAELDGATLESRFGKKAG